MWVGLWEAICYDEDGRERLQEKAAHLLQLWYTGSINAIRVVKRGLFSDSAVSLKKHIRLEDPELLFRFLDIVGDGLQQLSRKQRKDSKLLDRDGPD
jgi:hypothetical protein